MDSQIRTRHVSFRQRDDSADGDGRTLTGVAVPFNQQTRIDNWFEGTFDEQFAPGAFKRTLDHKTPVLQFDHGTHPMLGSIPVGTFRDLTETKRGLEVEAEIFNNWMTEPLRDAIRNGAIDGMSIRFRPIKVEIVDADAREDDDVELRTITEAELIELGPVVFPAYPQTSVDLRNIDLSNEDDRHRLAQALLSGAANTGDGPGSNGLGTTPKEAGVPAERHDPDSFHSCNSSPQRNRRQRQIRLLELELHNGLGSPP